MKQNFIPLLAVSLFCACGSSEDAEMETQEKATVAIVGEIGKTTTVQSRYAQSSENEKAEFIEGDAIGVFMNDNDVVRWTYSATSWVSETPVYWENRDEAHYFYAFYPYSTSTEQPESKDLVMMPTLSQQDGTWDNLPQYDFLTASTSQLYTDNQGTVLFTEDNAFNHVSSLLKLTIKGSGDVADATIDKILIEGDNITTPTYYSFTEGKTDYQEGTTQLNSVEIAPDHAMEDQDVTYYFILNGTDADDTESDEGLNLTIEYTIGEKKYVAQREDFASALLSGYMHSYNILIKSGYVIITGGIISDWTPGAETEDIIINGEEVSE